jgi:hypothetical protein
MDRISIETVKRRLFDIFSDKYEFNFDGYTNTYGKIDVFCKIHGWSQQIVKNLFKGHGCKKCGGIIASNKQRKNIDIIANEFKKVHGNKYDYSKFKYSNNKTNSTIICSQHGEFLQSPWTHLKGHGCLVVLIIENLIQKNLYTFQKIFTKIIYTILLNMKICTQRLK